MKRRSFFAVVALGMQGLLFRKRLPPEEASDFSLDFSPDRNSIAVIKGYEPSTKTIQLTADQTNCDVGGPLKG